MPTPGEGDDEHDHERLEEAAEERPEDHVDQQPGDHAGGCEPRHRRGGLLRAPSEPVGIARSRAEAVRQPGTPGLQDLRRVPRRLVDVGAHHDRP